MGHILAAHKTEFILDGRRLLRTIEVLVGHRIVSKNALKYRAKQEPVARWQDRWNMYDGWAGKFVGGLHD
ncbi:hypothetical protein GWI33_009315 [Rhynchophorus ferrugineus]|uniref:Uncharacterized protein n=1 Tax=Rhynchophorus ferrugineus TaxID=354439 RepID=A0A834IBQ1_RHYFE|nr:hypothetical protein GWI33_009315 [Rhynchophorus ferrugineus]